MQNLNTKISLLCHHENAVFILIYQIFRKIKEREREFQGVCFKFFINSARLLLKSFWELLCQFASVSKTHEEWLLLVISVIYLPRAKPRKLLWRYSILNAHCMHMIFLFEKFFKVKTACRVTVFVCEIFNLLIIGFYLLHICNSFRPNPLTDLLKFLYWYNGSNYI